MSSRTASLLLSLSLWSPALVAEEADAPPAASAAVTKEALEEGLSAALVEKLSAEQLKEVLLEREELRYKTAKLKEGGNGDSKVAILVPLFFFASLVVSVLGTLLYRFRRNRQLHETLRVMIERGAPIPPELLAPPRQKNADLRRGMVLLGTGVGGGLFGLAAGGAQIGAIGLIPLLIGAGYLIAWGVERNDERQEAVARAIRETGL